MPKQLALLIFAGFITWLFRRYSRVFGPPPTALWIPFVWVGINMSRALALWFSSGTAVANDVSEGSVADRTVYLLLIVLGSVVLIRRRINWSVVLKNSRWIVVLYIYYLVTTLWSDEVFVSIKRWTKDAGDLIMILIILTDKRPADALRAIFVRCAYLLIPLSVLVIKYYPEIGRYTHEWTYETFYSGVTTNKNALGVLAYISTIFLLWQIIDVWRKRDGRFVVKNIWPDLALVCMCVWLLILAHSSTSTGCLIVGTVILLFARTNWMRTHLRNMRWLAIGFGLFMLIFTVSDDFRGLVAGVLDRDVTLTDRTYIWAMALDSGTNPLVGCGFASYFISDHAASLIYTFHIGEAHNGYLENYLNTGWIGVILLFAMLASGGRKVIAHFSSGTTTGILLMSLFWSMLIYNYTESTFCRSNVVGLLLSFMAMFSIMPVDPSQNSDLRRS